MNRKLSLMRRNFQMNKVHIRPATMDDAQIIANFNTLAAKEIEDRQLDPATALAGLRECLLDSAKGFYKVAELGGEIVGQTMITFEWSDWRNGVFWWIQSVYIKPEARRRGIFTALYENIHAEARRRSDVCGLRLYVEKNNKRAQKIYADLGIGLSDFLMHEIDFYFHE